MSNKRRLLLRGWASDAHRARPAKVFNYAKTVAAKMKDTRCRKSGEMRRILVRHATSRTDERLGREAPDIQTVTSHVVLLNQHTLLPESISHND
jgi:hypothetical protein